MSSAPPKKPRARAGQPATPAAFYSGDAYAIDDSIGHMGRVLLNSMNRQIALRMQAYDLTAMQWRPLLMLRHGRADTAAALARLNCSDNGAMTRMLDRLEAKGLLRRVRSAVDRRVVHLELTAEGERVSDLIPHALSAVLNDHLQGFSPEEFRLLKTLLLRMIENGGRLAGAATTELDPS
jgi:DNA-binding MarR family transcriptional regulator